MKKYIILLLFIVASVASYFMYTNMKLRYGYIITGKLYESYKGSKELQVKVVNQQNKYKLVLDSLRIEINLNDDPSNKQKSLKSEALKSQYNILATDFKKYNEEYVVSEQAKIWSQLNQCISSYGKDKHYSFIYGADGSGNIMYADSSFNITEEIIEFANLKYDGK